MIIIVEYKYYITFKDIVKSINKYIYITKRKNIIKNNT